MTSKSPGTLVALLGPDLEVEVQMRWAVRLASVRELDLLILHRVESREERVVEVSLDKPPSEEATGVIHEVKQVIEESPALRAGPRGSDEAGEDIKATAPDSIHVRMKLIYFASLASLRRAVLDELGNRDVELFTLARKQIADMSDVDLVKERRLFLRYIPCEVVLCHGLDKQNALSRILVATSPGPNGRAALQIGQELAVAANGSLTALHVNPGVGIDAQQVGERRLERRLRKSPGADHLVVSRRVVVDDQIQQGIRRVWGEGNHDVVVVGLSGSRIDGSLGVKLGKHATVIIVSSVSPLANRFREFVDESFQRFVPQIEREDRIALVDRLQSSAAWNFDFLALMVLSTTMAAIGLIQNSAAVVIGAMLVAPLMTPLLGLGLALVQGNRVLATLSIRSVMFGLCVSLLGGFLVGITTLSFEEPTREMLSRGGPGLLDLSVAFAAGLAAAYASSRSSLIAALPGVAIAAALVPPIATSGLALSLGDFPLAMGALLLFLINMVTIVLASMASLWAVGFRNLKESADWTRMTGGAVIASVLALGVYLSLQSGESELTEELPAGLVAAVQKNVGKGYRFEDLAVAYDELGVQLYVQVVGKKPAPAKMATAVRTSISDHYKQPVRVRLMTRIATDTAIKGP